MNNKRRKEIERMICILESAKGDVELILQEEQDYYDAMPENMQQGDKGTAAEEAVNNLESAVGELESVLGSLEEAKN